MKKDFFIKQLDEIIGEYNVIKLKARNSDLSGNVSIQELTTLLSKAKAATARIVGNNSEYYKDIDAAMKKTHLWEGDKLNLIVGTITALRSDLANDYLKSISNIIQSDVFSDYLEMAEHLATQGYKDPAAVLTGSTLEVHLKELCLSNNIEIESPNSAGKIISKKADLLNSELAKAGVYSSSYQKQITAWLGLRNSAAHGKYTDYEIEEIRLMIQGVRQFILSTE